MADYAHTIHQRALKVLVELPRAERRKALRECETLLENPFVEPDYEQADADGRLVSHLIRGRFAIANWVDHGAKLVSITRIDLAD